MTVRCRCCHRVEHHGPDGVVVELAGGVRRPEPPAERAAFAWVLEIAGAGEVLFDACPACGMPRAAPAGAPAGGYRFALAGEPLVHDGRGFSRGGAPIGVDEARALVDAAYPPPPPPPASVRAAQGAMLLVMAAPFLFWAFLFGFWINYVVNLGLNP